MEETFRIKHGDLLLAQEKYLCHQCNCSTRRSAHLAKAVFDRFPYADDYARRGPFDDPGTIRVHGDGGEKRYVVNLFAQRYPGRSLYPNDDAPHRRKWLECCLDELAKLPGVREGGVAMPYLIGCGVAGGNWKDYERVIRGFSDENRVPVVLYDIDDLDGQRRGIKRFLEPQQKDRGEEPKFKSFKSTKKDST